MRRETVGDSGRELELEQGDMADVIAVTTDTASEGLAFENLLLITVFSVVFCLPVARCLMLKVKNR